MRLALLTLLAVLLAFVIAPLVMATAKRLSEKRAQRERIVDELRRQERTVGSPTHKRLY